MKNVIQLQESTLMMFLVVIVRFFAVAILSLISLFIAKKLLLKINPEINTRKILGI